MPKRAAKKDGSEEESEWEGNDDSSSSSESDPSFEPVGDEDKGAVDGGKRKARSPPRKKREVDIESEDEEDKFLPSSARLTSKGGYAHTSLSKRKISKANRGNTPWNKGKNRSSDDKAKISAGVKARNKAVLLEKLKKLGMSEEEYSQRKKEIKYARERLRVAKKLNQERRAQREERRRIEGEAEMEEEELVEEEATDEEAPVARTKSKATHPTTPVLPQAIYTKDIEWTSHPLDDITTYTEHCPYNSGGPGGLICCDRCTADYSSFLSATCKDVETQKSVKLGQELKELVGMLSSTTSRLTESVDVARRKPPPLLRMSGSEMKTGKSATSSAGDEKPKAAVVASLHADFPTAEI